MRKSRPLCTKTTCTKNLVWCKSSTEWCKPLSILDPQLVLNCLAAGLQTLQGFGKVFQQLHYLCESDYGLNTTSGGAVQSYNIPYESSYGVSICLSMWLKSSLHLSRVCHSHQTSWRDQFSRFMLGTHDLRAPNVEVVKFEDLIWCKPSTEWCKPLSILDPQLVLNCLAAGLQNLQGFSKVFQQLHYLCESDHGWTRLLQVQCRATIFHENHVMGVSICLSMWLKSSLHLSRVRNSHQTSWREQFSRCMLE